MNFEEYASKPLLAAGGLDVPKGQVAGSVEDAVKAAQPLLPCMVKAQVPTGKRGKAGGIKRCTTLDEVNAAAAAILGMEIAGFTVETLLIEGCSDFTDEYYAAVLNDPETKGPKILFSTMGGMEVEEALAEDPNAMRSHAVDIRTGVTPDDLLPLLEGLDLSVGAAAVADTLAKLYGVYANHDAELLEINPLVVTTNGALMALDCKFVLDDSAIKRREELATKGTPDKLTGLEAKGADLGLKYIELEGTVGVLANGAGLTMTTMDVVRHHGGVPANFLEIGGEAYTKGKDALSLVLENPQVKSLVINFCGAFARTDVMTEGILSAFDELKPDLPVFWSVHGTGDVEAVAMLKARGIAPLPDMSAACKAAVDAAKGATP